MILLSWNFKCHGFYIETMWQGRFISTVDVSYVARLKPLFFCPPYTSLSQRNTFDWSTWLSSARIRDNHLIFTICSPNGACREYWRRLIPMRATSWAVQTKRRHKRTAVRFIPIFPSSLSRTGKLRDATVPFNSFEMPQQALHWTIHFACTCSRCMTSAKKLKTFPFCGGCTNPSDTLCIY